MNSCVTLASERMRWQARRHLNIIIYGWIAHGTMRYMGSLFIRLDTLWFPSAPADCCANSIVVLMQKMHSQLSLN